MKPFLLFQGSRACPRTGFFSGLFTSRFKEAGLRIPFDKLRAAVSPIPKSRKEQRPSASLFRKNFMALPGRRIPHQKRHLYTPGRNSCGVRAIIDYRNSHVQALRKPETEQLFTKLFFCVFVRPLTWYCAGLYNYFLVRRQLTVKAYRIRQTDRSDWLFTCQDWGGLRFWKRRQIRCRRET